jgi:peroxiredoxin
MPNRTAEKKRRRAERADREAQRRQAERARALRLRVFAALGAAILVLAGLFALNNAGGGGSSSSKGNGGRYAFAVGSPGPGAPAPAIKLPSTGGRTFDLAAQRGKTTLLYFQEGLTCQPCWDQIKDLEKGGRQVKALGIDSVVSITTDRLGAVRRKAQDEGLRTPVLSDPDLAVSRAYAANQYGMMGDSRDGHSFIVVGPDGRIRFRADYGGPPNFTMFVPVPDLVADLRRGLAARRS